MNRDDVRELASSLRETAYALDTATAGLPIGAQEIYDRSVLLTLLKSVLEMRFFSEDLQRALRADRKSRLEVVHG